MNFSTPIKNGEDLYLELKRRLMDDMRSERLEEIKAWFAPKPKL